jgi:hypothetical protein
MTQVHAHRSSLFVPAITAGVIGAIIVDAFLSIELHVSPIVLEAGIATTAFGIASPALGVVVHLVIAIVWAVIYAYVFNAIGQLQNWILGAIVLGIVVDAVMNAIITMKTGTTWGSAFVDGLITNVVFYALPVAWYIANRSPRVRA